MRGIRSLIVLSVALDIVVLLLAIGRAEQLCSIIPIWLLFYLGALALLLALVVFSLIVFASRFRRDLISASLPLLLNISTLLIVTLLPLESIPIHNRFLSNLNAYTQVVALVEQGNLRPSFHSFAYLPEEYKRLSNEAGEILVQKDEEATRVFIFAHGCCFCYAGYMYRSSGEPQAADFGGEAKNWQCHWQEQPNWWYCERID